ncbi:MAG TPA: hypothetical protein PLP17_04455 [Oligoflexia bacterium]|nr:hypothetical protein [Oligoflexia bacterium]
MWAFVFPRAYDVNVVAAIYIEFHHEEHEGQEKDLLLTLLWLIRRTLRDLHLLRGDL